MFDANTLRNILLRLPAESLFRLRAVCKGWCAVIDDPGFVKAHTNNNNEQVRSTLLLKNSTGPPFYPLYSLNLDDVNFTNATQTIPATPLLLSRTGLSRLKHLPVAVCNGLMLIVPLNRKEGWVFESPTWDPERTLEIWNPLTHDRLSLLQPNLKSKKVVGYGFGYDPAGDDYKVVVIYYKEKNHSRQTQVYSLKSGSWRKIENCPFDLYNIINSGRQQQGAFLNGALHWISGDEATKSWDTITVLDLTTEKYQRLACPPLNEHPKQLDALGGCLLLSYLWLGENPHLNNNIDNRRFDIWVMNDYGFDDSWIKLFSLKGTGVLNQLRLVAYMKNKNGALLQHSNGFSWFDAESNSSKMVSIHGICEHSKKYSAQICVGTLFRLRDSCGRVASEKQTRKSNREMKMTAHTKLTLCVRDVDKDHHTYKFDMSHDCCYGYDSNCYNSSSHGIKKIRMTPHNPDIYNFTTHSVPLDICREIFLRMPAKSLIRFRSVCNAWRAVIDDPFFVKAHANKQLSSNIIIRNSTGPPFYPLYSFDLDDLNFSNGLKSITATPLDFTSSVLSRLQVLPMATCNGLILIAPLSRGKIGFNDEISLDWDRKGTWEIWNPLTHERLELPKQDSDSFSGLTAWGLGYDCSTDDYKAVTIHYQHDCKRVEIINEKENQTHVYSLKLDSWTRIGNCPYSSWRPVGCSVFLNGVLYWIAADTIFALDLRTENYRQLEHPAIEVRTNKFDHRKQIDVLGGCLIVSEYFHNDCTPVFVLWVMEEDGAQCSWVKLFHTHQRYIDSHFRPVSFLKNKMQILFHNGRRQGLYLFDVKSESEKKVSIHGLTGDLYAQVVPKSIFRIHDNCGVTGRRRRRRVMKKTENMKLSDTVLTFCVRNADKSWNSLLRDDPHDSCYSLDANWYYPSSEDED